MEGSAGDWEWSDIWTEMRLRESSHMDIWKWNILGRNQLSPEMGKTKQFWEWHWGAERRRSEGGGNRKQEGAGATKWDFLYHAEMLHSVLSGKDFKEKNKIWLRAFAIDILKTPLASSSVERNFQKKKKREWPDRMPWQRPCCKWKKEYVSTQNC